LTTSIAFSPDGKLLATSYIDKTIRIWDVASAKQLKTLETTTEFTTTITFSPDGKLLASGDLDGVIDLWDVASGAHVRSIKDHSGWITSVAFSPDGKLLASGSVDKTVRLWDVATRSQIKSFEGHSDQITAVVFGADGKRLVSSSGDATIKVWSIDTSAPLASLTSLGKNEWLVVTPDNLFDGSATAWRRSIWRFSSNTFDYAPVEAFFSEFYHPGLLAEIMSGRTPKANRNISEKDIRQPDVKIVRADGDSSDVTLPTVKVEVEVTEAPTDAKKNLPSGGVRDVRLFRNGSLVKVWHGDAFALDRNDTCRKPVPGRVICVSTVPIVAGENRLTAYAFNRDNVKSRDGELVINGADSLKRAGTLYVLAIGINRYANPAFNLRYAVADARDFAREVKKQQDNLKLYASTEIIPLTDREASKANILMALRRLRQSRPEDAVMIYFAGHGTTDKDRFYLVPHDLGVMNKLSAIDKRALQSLHAHSISDLELESALERIDAGQLLMIIDACNSGQALEAEEKRRGPMNSKGLAQLAYEKGIYILTAAQSYQVALEVSRLGHGLLTYSLLEGLMDLRADADRNKEVWDREWMDYAMDRVPQMQVEEMKRRGAEIIFLNDDDHKPNVQRPRVFYRREPAPQPLIIAGP
jgi:caspase domain-containing protein/WD40 domain-containing protein